VSTPTRQTNGTEPRSRTHSGTRLKEWLAANGLTSAQLEREIHMTRQSMGRIKRGQDVRRRTMIRLLRGCRALAHRKVMMEEIFDLDPDSPVNAP
jgi:transcriptional regulator with XRE-family HTH domain